LKHFEATPVPIASVAGPADRSDSSPIGLPKFAPGVLLSYLLGTFLFLYAGSYFYGFVVGDASFPTRNVILIGMGALFAELVFFKRAPTLVYFIFAVILSGYLASALFYGRGLLGDAAMILGNAGILLVLLRRRMAVTLAYAIFLGFAGYIGYGVANGVTPDDVLSGSRNGVSWGMLEAVALLYIVLDKERRKIGLWPALITLVLCAWSAQRSGILASGLLFLGVAGLYFRQNRVTLLVLVLPLVAFFASAKLESLGQMVDLFFFRFEMLGLASQDRGETLGIYWNRLDAITFFLGQDLTRDAVWQLWGLNPHNSYLLMHSWLGFAAFILMGLILGAVVKSFFCQNKIYCLLLIVLLLRAATDILFFLSTFDFLIYYLVVRIYGEPAPAITRMWSAVAHRALETL